MITNIINAPQNEGQGSSHAPAKQPAKSNTQILNDLLGQITPVDFVALAYPEIAVLKNQLQGFSPDSEESKSVEKQIKKLKITEREHIVYSVEQLITIAEKNDWGLCRNQGNTYIYNGMYWVALDEGEFMKFLCKAAERMGVPITQAKYYQFGEKLMKQFAMNGYLPTPELRTDTVLICLQNGTYEIRNGEGCLREFRREDFQTCQLPFEYNPDAQATVFGAFLERVLPDRSAQDLLAEYIGYLFIRNGGKLFKIEKVLLLYGTGANGKSVFFEVVKALLGPENMVNHSLQDLSNENGYYRAQLANKLVNYSSEINGRVESAVFKQLASGEPVTARLPYGNPVTLTNYAKLIFNCNELPRGGEHSHAYFRRFLIIPFEVTIPEEEQDRTLHNKIIDSELSGVFNWVLAGLRRLLEQKGFTECIASKAAVEDFKASTDSVKQYLMEENYVKSALMHHSIPDLYRYYKEFCSMDGYLALGKQKFLARLKGLGIEVKRISSGNVAFIEKGPAPEGEDEKNVLRRTPRSTLNSCMENFHNTKSDEQEYITSTGRPV